MFQCFTITWIVNLESEVNTKKLKRKMERKVAKRKSETIGGFRLVGYQSKVDLRIGANLVGSGRAKMRSGPYLEEHSDD